MNYKARNQKNGYIKEENGNKVKFTLNKDGNPKTPQTVFNLEKDRPRFLNYYDYYYDENDKLEFFKEVDKNEHYTTTSTENFYMDEGTIMSHIQTEEVIHGDSVNTTEIETGRDHLKKKVTRTVKVKGEQIDYHQANFWHYTDGTVKMTAEIFRNKNREEIKVREFKPNGDIENSSEIETKNGNKINASHTRYDYNVNGKLKQKIVTKQGSETLTL